MTQVTISIDVPDLEAATSFYCNALGCTKLNEGNATIARLSADNVKLYLLLKEAGSPATRCTADVRSYSRHWTPVHLDFGVTNLEQAIAEVTALGGSHEGTDSGGWGAIAYCADPFGNGFCLIKE